MPLWTKLNIFLPEHTDLLQAGKLTGTFHALVYEAVKQRAAVVAEGGTGVSLDLKCVSTLQVLKFKRKLHWRFKHTHKHKETHTDRVTVK